MVANATIAISQLVEAFFTADNRINDVAHYIVNHFK